jgi:cupin fold WbuC family metalloprotein
MIAFTQKNPEVFVAESDVVSVSDKDIDFLKEQALANPRKRARICAHRDSAAALHEMIIAIAQGSYLRPHKHIGKSESFHIIEGDAHVVLLDDNGEITRVIALGARGTGKSPFYRLSDDQFHMLVVQSEILVMHEVTDGPFIREQTIQAAFAPDEAETEKATAYLNEINQRIRMSCH